MRLNNKKIANKTIKEDIFNKFMDELKADLVIDNKVNFDKVYLREHLLDMVQKIEEQDKQIEKYKTFFSTLSNFLPKTNQIKGWI